MERSDIALLRLVLPIILEAMKMEHSLLAQRIGEVAEVYVKEGDQVEAGAALIRLAPDASGEE